MATENIKVLYIIGKGRSGSTILDTVLGQLEGFFSTGELWHLWEWGLLEGRRCGCGEPVTECEMWSVILAKALGEPLTVDPAEVYRWKREAFRWSRTPRLFRARRETLARWPELRAYVQISERLYGAIAAVTGARVIVDSSKWPAHPGLLGLVSGIDPYALQLVRDPRAVTYSYRRRKHWDERAEMPRFGPAHTTTSWIARNLSSEVARRRGTGRSAVLRYEDFVRDPGRTLERIAALVGESPRDLPLTGDGKIRLAPNHTVGGNSSRFSVGELELREDDEWLTGLGRRDRVVSTLMTLPFLRRYGYRPSLGWAFGRAKTS